MHEDAPPPIRDAIWMGTVHQSKGLQWKVVYIVRFNEVRSLPPEVTRVREVRG